MTIAQAIHRLRSLLGVLLVLATAARLSAQEAPVADPKDVASVDAIMASVYDVISGPAAEERDWDRMRSLFLPEARLIPSFVNPAGEIGIQYLSLEDWIDQAAGYFADNAFYEVEIHRVEERYGHIAHAFSTYESRTEADGAPFARGINSFQLLYDGERWWVVNIYWQGETDMDPIPSAYLP
jgi:hypothetical protein